jgi:hypothetical protein
MEGIAMCLQAAKQAASELCAGLKDAVLETTAVVDVAFVCALAKTSRRALETRVVKKRILNMLMEKNWNL